MVAPKQDGTRRTKWRTRCSTCGLRFKSPQKWAYCCKACELARRGRDQSDSEGGLDEWLDRIYEERLQLRDARTIAMPWEVQEIDRKLAANQAREDAMRAELAALNAPRDSLAFWAPRLRQVADRWEASVRRSLTIALQLGRKLLEAKAVLPHGEFGRLFRDHENAVQHALPFSSSWAQRLMSIAGHPALANPEHAPHLPTDLQTVYVLSRVPTGELEAAIERGDVTPDMRRADARDLLAPDDRGESDPPDPIERLLDPIGRALRRFAGEHPECVSDLRVRLKAMLRAIENASAPPRASEAP